MPDSETLERWEGPKCGAYDNENPYLECGLPWGHPGPHIHDPDRPDSETPERCPACWSTLRAQRRFVTNPIPTYKQVGEVCSHPWHYRGGSDDAQ